MDVLSNPKKYFWITLFQSSSFLTPVLTLFYLHRGLDLQQIFILYTVIVISMFIFEIPTGIIGDKFGRKTSIILGLIGWFLFNVGLIFAKSFLIFFLLFILWGINATFASGSDEALIYDSLKQKKKQKEMQKHMGRVVAARFIPLIIIAPIAAFVAKDLTSFQFMLLILGNIFFVLLSLILSFTLVEPKISTGPHEIRSPVFLFKSAVKHIKNSPKLVRLFVNKTLILIPGSHIFAILWQPYLKDSGIPVAYFGIFVAVASIIIWKLMKNIDKIESKYSGVGVLTSSGVALLLAFTLAAFFQNIAMAIIFYFVIKILVWLREPIFSKFMNEHIESHNRATVLSSLSMIDSMFDVVIFLSAGFIANFSMSYSFLFSAALMLLALLFFRVTNKHIKVKS
jgi:MFS family permease